MNSMLQTTARCFLIAMFAGLPISEAAEPPRESAVASPPSISGMVVDERLLIATNGRAS